MRSGSDNSREEIEETRRQPQSICWRNLRAYRRTGHSQPYTVKRGDTLSAIAELSYGNVRQYPKIFRVNEPNAEGPEQNLSW
jgi:nucleoid-associated protein YgaU